MAKPYNAWGIHILFKQAFNGSIILVIREYAEMKMPRLILVLIWTLIN
jgi:hypothetical protein